jgi:GNAT superfamily N-acetyltransferase
MECLIRDYEGGDFEESYAIAADLSEFFNETGLAHMKVDLLCLRGLVAEDDGKIVGFLVYCSEEGVMHVRWIGVTRPYHGMGVGRALLVRLEEMACRYGIREIRTETLGDSVDYEPYERTRAFWRGCGFSDLERIMQDDPGWPEKLVLHKRVSSIPGTPEGKEYK